MWCACFFLHFFGFALRLNLQLPSPSFVELYMIWLSSKFVYMVIVLKDKLSWWLLLTKLGTFNLVVAVFAFFKSKIWSLHSLKFNSHKVHEFWLAKFCSLTIDLIMVNYFFSTIERAFPMLSTNMYISKRCFFFSLICVELHFQLYNAGKCWLENWFT